MPIVATAGHVDHGKSTLVQALTGRDPDRWAEEKRRGLTIDLGFAWTRLGRHYVGFVDVPGHERFIKNMLAGVGAVDVALFVVAADEGWMPQTEEHLAVLDGLGIATGVIALSRTDLVDPDLVQLAAAEVAERTEGTSLAGWPVVAVSGVSGAGLEELRSTLAAALDAAKPPPDIGRPRMWIDRAFVVGGAGLVVTGTLTDGSLRRGDTVTLWPEGVVARIRTVQSHETESESVSSGSRAALNLVGPDKADVPRGTMLGRGAFRTTRRLLVELRPVRSWPAAVADRGAYHLHAGTGHWPVTVRLLAAKRLAAPGPALLQLATPLPLRAGDRFIVREVGRRVVVAGGLVLDPAPDSIPSARRSAASLVAAAPLGRNAVAGALLEVRGVTTTSALDADTGGGSVDGAFGAGEVVMTRAAVVGTLETIGSLVSEYHAGNPKRPGIPLATIASAARLDPAVVDALVRLPSSDLVVEQAVVRRRDFGVEWSPTEEAAWTAARTTLREAGLAAPRSSSLGLSPEHFHGLVRNGELVVVADDLAYLPEQLDDVIRRLDDLGDGFTVAEFRDALGVTRRQAVPLLEWLDASGWTSRRGDVRTVRRRPPSSATDDVPTR
jgi:selenocysteine-specific elongation factor